MLTLKLLIVFVITNLIIRPDIRYKTKSNHNTISKKYIFPAAISAFARLILSAFILMVIDKEYILEVIIKVIVVSAVSFFIYLGKEAVEKKLENKEKFWSLVLYTFEQIVQIIAIIVITYNSPIEYNKMNQWIINMLGINHGFVYDDLKSIFILLYITFSGAYLLPLIFDVIYKKVPNYNEILNDALKKDMEDESGQKKLIDEVKTGKWIGILERFLIVLFLNAGQYSSIGFIIAIKSLARFKMMEIKIFAEYYLLGTLCSVGYTILMHYIFQKVLA